MHLRYGNRRVGEDFHHVVLERDIVLGEDTELALGFESDHHFPAVGFSFCLVVKAEHQRVAGKTRVLRTAKIADAKLSGPGDPLLEPRKELSPSFFEIATDGLRHGAMNFRR